jgi:DNA-binding Lrp family transcriptional regulator
LVASKHLSDLEKQALELIRKTEGILQSDLWKKMKLDSREGSRLVLRLVKKGLVRREQVTVNGRRTYKLFAVQERPRKVDLLIDVSTALKVPCMTCPFFHECRPNDFHNPASCPILDIWLQREIQKRRLLKEYKAAR